MGFSNGEHLSEHGAGPLKLRRRKEVRRKVNREVQANILSIEKKFLTALLRYNSHTTQFLHLKCIIQWILVYKSVREQDTEGTRRAGDHHVTNTPPNSAFWRRKKAII